MEKFYLYVDESGQDTEGVYFIVVVVILLQGIADELEKTVERIERETRKGKSKWRPTKFRVRTAYLTRITELPELEQAVFYISFPNTKDYTKLTAIAIAHTILEKATGGYRAYIMVDGLKDKDRSQISKHYIRKESGDENSEE
ncbi:hypothetical protein IH992_23770 [Candidatus Poribacteria bacterium]|nr:hypothetical protein [Candidatus Poribacteria bacterium]